MNILDDMGGEYQGNFHSEVN